MIAHLHLTWPCDLNPLEGSYRTHEVPEVRSLEEPLILSIVPEIINLVKETVFFLFFSLLSYIYSSYHVTSSTLEPEQGCQETTSQEEHQMSSS